MDVPLGYVKFRLSYVNFLMHASLDSLSTEETLTLELLEKRSVAANCELLNAIDEEVK